VVKPASLKLGFTPDGKRFLQASSWSIPTIRADAPLFHLKIRADLTQFTMNGCSIFHVVSLSRLIGCVPLVPATHTDFLHAIWHFGCVSYRKRSVRTKACNRS